MRTPSLDAGIPVRGSRAPSNARAVGAAAVVAFLLLSSPVTAASRPPERGAHAMVASPEAHATEVGLDVLRRGGNAVDAAVATAFALSVTYPRAGSLGGGGFLLRRSPAATHDAIDFRETAPAALQPGLFLDEGGRPVPDRALRGGLAVGVPGVVLGLWEAHGRWGSRRWNDLLQPAIALARKGFPISETTAATLKAASEELGKDPEARRLFFRGAAPLRAGEVLVQSDLAVTLRRIASDGADAFYRGPVAEALARAVREAGGVMTVGDLAGYRPVGREPLAASYRGRRILTFPPPSAGGVAILEALGILERFDLGASGPGSSLTIHRIAEATRRAFADRSRWLGDPAFVRVPLRGLLDAGYLASRAATLRDDVATPTTEIGPGTPPSAEGRETLHFTVADDAGSVVALTTTINSNYGAALVAPGTGVLLNNEMGDFSLAPGVADQFGLVGEAANSVAPGKRPLSSMAPTLVESIPPGPRPVLALGSPGGSTIVSSVLEVLVAVLDHGLALQEAVDAPRFHHQWVPDQIEHEARAFPEDVARALRARGHVLRERPPIGNVCAVGLDPNGAWTGASDPRGEGSAHGY